MAKAVAKKASGASGDAGPNGISKEPAIKSAVSAKTALKRPLSSYFIWLAENRASITAEVATEEAQILEMVGDLRHAEDRLPDNVLFVCNLNPMTTDEDLSVIFSRFGQINCCEVIRDRRTRASLQYPPIEFDTPEYCEAAFSKMDNVLIDDRRIHVDFSQSVSKSYQWQRKRTITPAQNTEEIKKSDRRGHRSRSGDKNRRDATGGGGPEGSVSKIAGKEWKAPENKSKWEKLAAEAKQKFEAEKFRY